MAQQRKQGSSTFFFDKMNLVDSLHQKHRHNGIVHTTHSRGKHRINFILVYNMIVPAIERIGAFGLHKGIISDHVMLYMDCDETELFSGMINHPVLKPSREFIIKHVDKCEQFVDKFREHVKENKIADRVQTLSKAFERDSPSENNVNRFQVLDTKITECILSAAKTVARKEFGYQRLPTLTEAGTSLHFWKAALSTMSRRVHLGKLQLQQADKCNIDPSKVHDMTTR